MTIESISSTKAFGGWHKQYSHQSSALNCTMRFAIYLPPQAEGQKVPVLYWLSGLTCTDENFMQKAGALRIAAELGMAIVATDTSPRGEGVADDADGAYDFGLGASFYLNATKPPFNQHYQMYDYVVSELPALIEAHFPVTNQRSISGHSMGGHGAMTIALKNPDLFNSVSAFSPICHPMDCPWGIKAFRGYLGDDHQQWKQYDSCELMANSQKFVPALVDQGSNDNFLDEQLKPQALVNVAKDKGYPLEMRMQPGYDHSYYFVATFIEDHLYFHAKHLSLS
ncbi:S-formylglutathione hydrolase [Shewanella sp. SG41-4]|uniref:S-formylglutathione hydrolase n=1 Tax=Shewanella sp. SG41-4 TaxID=2760976 RepID=UPI001602B0FE|nr:S-formylglutathione hydrolase [Shewanella sp. SG41-4]MBB1437710.1 S-formylglutathione hydrolase [Shewanella sp. SG41-4]